MRYPVGALVFDSQSKKLGYVMRHEGSHMQLRPVGGGRGWEADPACVRRATDEERRQAMEERTSALNSASSGGIL
ncbi:hypothetical protein [Streptomyces thermoalcalitolerans]|uniref:Uncharacterized protein n=1 Tax=Streptomyces thermoalcalitolerans TaxID=65605 RepID=A0ABN1NPX6_9ACTN